MQISTKKVVAAVVGLGLALSIFAGVGALSANAQSMTASQLVDLFISLGIISSDKAAAAKAAVSSQASVSFAKDLTVGSSGADVTALQNAIGVSPATGYFGSITKAAVVKYQASKGLPATGYVGPLTRAELNKGSSMTTGGTTNTGSTPVVNSGVEGTLTVEKASVSNTTVYEGETMRPVLGIKLEAKLSDINIQRVKLNLGANTSIYTKVFKTAYITDDSGRVLAQADLNSNTVVKDSGSYYLTLGGFSYNVPKDSTKYLWVKADLYSSIKAQSASGCDGTGDTCTITLAADGVRGVDGAGLDQYGPVSEFSQGVAISTSLVDSATLDASVNSANFKAADVVASLGSNNDELDKLPLLAFDLRANKADIKVTDLTFTLSDTADQATTTTAYLYDGSTLVMSESVTGSTITFDDIDNLIVAKDGTKTLSLKVDVRTATNVANSLSASLTNIIAENLQGTQVSDSGAPAGEVMTIRKVGPVFSLVGTPTMTRTTVSSNDTSGVATSTGSANFTVSVTAVGGDITFGSSASTTTLFGDSNGATTTATWLAVYKNGASNAALSANTAGGTNAIVSYSMPSSGVTIDGQSFTLAKNNTVQIPVTVQFTVAGSSANQYAVQINGFRWQAAGVGQASSVSMTNKTEWRTPSVSLP
ncbi:MAG: peptidoglycan-binding protein [Candidatus Taylorbacteria bacterium]|nr:peptidoglycan-binding protein [Candidatus Taylorbacteria bacterium]